MRRERRVLALHVVGLLAALVVAVPTLSASADDGGGTGTVPDNAFEVDDALLHVGDPHFAQGDGEVALTALEAPLRATLRVDVVPAAEAAMLSGVSGPFAVAQGMLVPVGLSENLELALRRCVRNAVGLLTSLVDVDPHRAYLYLSAAADFAVSQAVDIVKGVHGAIRVSDFAEFRPGPFTDRILAAVARSLEVV